MTFTVTQDQAQLIILTKDAIRAMNNLTIFLNKRQFLLPAEVRQRLVEADYLLNSSEDHFIVEYRIDPNCPLCHGSGTVTTGGPDHWGNYDTDDCRCQTDPDFDPADYEEEDDYP